MSLSATGTILRIPGDDEEEVAKYVQKMQQIYEAARRMKVKQVSSESRDD